jgi:protein SCO1/2
MKHPVPLHRNIEGRPPTGRSSRAAAWLAGALLTVTAAVSWADSASQHHLGRGTLSSKSQYIVPAVQLIRDDGKLVSLPAEMNDGRPVVLNFIFTSCSSVCPLMSEVFAQFARKLGSDRDKVHLMSISIDPEQDTPARLREYAQRFEAGSEWQHYTGTVEASLAAQRAFAVYRGDKMSHTAVTLLRVAPGMPWLRLDGFVTPDELLEQYRQLLQEQGRTMAAR